METEVTQVLQLRFRTNDGPTVFLKIYILRDTRLDVLEVCSRISQSERRRHRSCIEDDAILVVIGRCALVDRPGVGGR